MSSNTTLVALSRKATAFIGVLTLLLVFGFMLSQNKWNIVPHPVPGSRYLLKKSIWNISVPQRDIQANCTLLFKGDKKEIEKVLKLNKEWKGPSDTGLFSKANHCSWITQEFDNKFYTSDVELKFPLAFALNVYNAPQQIFRFLKVIYRPHNVYCLHYDQKSAPQFKQLMINIANCLPNIIVPKKIENVVWGWHTIVDAQMNCLNDLYELRERVPWKYAITLCGKEVPLRTNREMVQTLSKLNGTSVVPLSTVLSPKRWTYKYVLWGNSVRRTKKKLGPVPFNFTIKKSMAYVGLTEPFVDFLLHNETSIKFRKFMDQTHIPDEHYIATLYKAPGVPGGYSEKFYPLLPVIDNYFWTSDKAKCSGHAIHRICIVNSADIHRLKYRPRPNSREVFFHNKFFMAEDHTVIDCLEEELIQRNMNEFAMDQNLLVPLQL